MGRVITGEGIPMAAVEIGERLARIEVIPAEGPEGLQVFGLRWAPQDASPDNVAYLTLDEGLASSQLIVTEVSEGGSVPDLLVVNDSDAMVLLVAGEQLIGAKQNRVLNASLLLAPRSRTKVPVSCVEAGRWRYRSRAFFSSGTSSPGMMRSALSKGALLALKRRGEARADQAEVWRMAAEVLSETGSHSPTAALEQAYVDRKAQLDDIVRCVHVPSDCAGVVFAVAGGIAGLDLFDRPATLQKLLPKLVRSYALDSLAARRRPGPPANPLDAAAVRAWLGALRQARAERFPTAGLGSDIRIESAEVVGASLTIDDHPVHTELFPESRPR